MSVSLLEVIEAGGYDINTKEDASWLLSKQTEFEALIELAQDIVDSEDEILSECCSALITENTDFCSDCKEHTGVEI